MRIKNVFIVIMAISLVTGNCVSSGSALAAVDGASILSQSYEESVEDAIDYINYTIDEIIEMRQEGVVENHCLLELTSDLYTLLNSINSDEEDISEDAVNVLTYTDTVLNVIVQETSENAGGLAKAREALQVLRLVIENKQTEGSENQHLQDDEQKIAEPTTVTPTMTPAISPTPILTDPQKVTPPVKPTIPANARPTITPKPTQKPYRSQRNYRNTEVSVADLKSWDWANGGTIQIGGFCCNFGRNKSNGIIWVEKDKLVNYKVTDADIVVTVDQWEELSGFAYGKYKYETSFYDNFMLKRTTKMTLKYSDKYRPLPQAGDIFIDKNDKKTKLTAQRALSTACDGWDILVGYGQKLDLYSGMSYEDTVLKPGDVGITWYGDRTNENNYYLLASNGEGHFEWEWAEIAWYELSLAKKIKKPKDKQRCGYWLKYNAKRKSWIWTGPVLEGYPEEELPGLYKE